VHIFEDLLLRNISGHSVGSTSEVRMLAMFVVLNVGNYEVQ